MGQVIGLDTCIFIYLLEANPDYVVRAKNILLSLGQGSNSAVLASISLIEILTGPKKQNRYDLASQYLGTISQFPHLTIMGLTESIIELSSDLRARYGIPTPDAIHVATAIDYGADKFITNDKALKKIKEIKIELL